jgi:hypothetical protein
MEEAMADPMRDRDLITSEDGPGHTLVWRLTRSS